MIPNPQPEAGATHAGSHYVTQETAKKAVAMAAPLIDASLGDRNIVGSGFLYLVVMDPGLPPGFADFEAAILHEQAFGARERWDADYAAFARAKARLSWTFGMDSHRLQTVALCLRGARTSLPRAGGHLDGLPEQDWQTIRPAFGEQAVHLDGAGPGGQRGAQVGGAADAADCHHGRSALQATGEGG